MSARSAELNLLPKEIWEKGVIGQLFRWVLSVGRYVVVFTELIVISAFLYRFGLDRILTDLHSSIKNKQSVITSFGDLEPNFRLIQAKLTKIKTVGTGPKILTALNVLSKITPADATLVSLNVSQENVVIEGRVLSQTGLATILYQAQNQPEFSDVILENVQSAREKSDSIEFRLTLVFKTT